MSSPYLGEIRMFSGNYAPDGWALCNGQMLSISGNEALYALLGTTYGGDGLSTFALPDLQGRLPIHLSSSYAMAAKGGTEAVTLTVNQLPGHAHTPMAAKASGTTDSPVGSIWAQTPDVYYSGGEGMNPVPMNGQLISPQGGNQPHDNTMPSLVVSFIIALQGIYPQQN